MWDNYLESTCRFRQAECRNCGKVSHIAKVCHSKIKRLSKKTSKDQATHSIQQDSPFSTKPCYLHQCLHNNNAVIVYDLFPVKSKTIQLF